MLLISGNPICKSRISNNSFLKANSRVNAFKFFQLEFWQELDLIFVKQTDLIDSLWFFSIRKLQLWRFHQTNHQLFKDWVLRWRAERGEKVDFHILRESLNLDLFKIINWPKMNNSVAVHWDEKLCIPMQSKRVKLTQGPRPYIQILKLQPVSIYKEDCWSVALSKYKRSSFARADLF